MLAKPPSFWQIGEVNGQMLVTTNVGHATDMSPESEHNQRFTWRAKFISSFEWRIGFQFGTFIAIIVGILTEFIFGKIELANHVSTFHYDVVFWLIFFLFVWLDHALNPR
jgi:hypothetical protein